MYESDQDFFELMDDKSEKLALIVERLHPVKVDETIKLINLHFELLRTSIGMMGLNDFTGRNHSESLLFSTLHKNSLNFYAAIKLVKRGLHGSAALFLRPIFESLYMAKYCACSDDLALFDRWSNGGSINLSNHVLNKIQHPPIPETRELFKAFHGFTHAGIYSQQISLDPKIEIEQISVKIALISTLVLLSHHLVLQHYITTRLKYYVDRYAEDDRFNQALLESRIYASALRRRLSKTGRKLYREYSSKWVLK